ncbi:MarR family winged helix-turn-helix transcriptional regulator [Lysinibacter cavernae]|uniref:DNA-binding MarR family transcriptional regulator n=1 Tax=Lysinibacter cavernae TaxID=1640652 RepID=A0A7X5QZ29_9MICO|nr:MarR family transcriptional regulator [Lysinibacter cavernae]NIH52579.1 DNA-binding MarR family transcriptional regulator [Lysinibacter cavernae]
MGSTNQEPRLNDPAIATIEEQFSLLFNRAKTAWREAAISIDPGLQPFGYKMVSILARRGPMNAGDLATLLETDKSVVSRQLRMLESLGLVETAADPLDGRGRILSATPKAITALTDGRNRPQERVLHTLRCWKLSEVEAFAELLSKLNEDTLQNEE